MPINSISHSPARQSMAFTGKHHLGAAVASVIVPGSGQLIKGDTKRGLTHLGIFAGLLAAGAAVGKSFQKTFLKNIEPADKVLEENGGSKKYFKTLFKDIPKSVKAALVLLFIAATVNRVSAVVNAFKPNKSKPEQA